MNKIKIPDGLAGKELFKFLVGNKEILIAQKKYEVKHADTLEFKYSEFEVTPEGSIIKSTPGATGIKATADTENTVYLAINTTNYLDSHSDVHIPGIWKKSLSQTKTLYLLQEHQMKFDKIITDKVKGYTQTMSWKDLGYNSAGVTEVLIFRAELEEDRNPFMVNEYKKKRVKNHSVGMVYVKIELCINEPEDEYYKVEFAAWTKYIDQVVNRSDAEAKGYFWAVTEAKVIEGSAVPIGSNPITPTLESKSTSIVNEPVKTIQEQPQKFDIMEAIKKTNFLIP